MKRIATTYAVIAILLEMILARAYQLAVPGFRYVYARIYEQDLLLPHITEFFLEHNGIFYLPPVAITLGILIALRKSRDNIAMHATYLGLLIFLCLGVVLVVALFLPFIVTLGKVTGIR